MGKYVESIHLCRISSFFVSFSESFVALAEKWKEGKRWLEGQFGKDSSLIFALCVISYDRSIQKAYFLLRAKQNTSLQSRGACLDAWNFLDMSQLNCGGESASFSGLAGCGFFFSFFAPLDFAARKIYRALRSVSFLGVESETFFGEKCKNII